MTMAISLKIFVSMEDLSPNIFGSDQLTVCHHHSTQSACCNDDVSEEYLDGYIPVTEDWHVRMTVSAKPGVYAQYNVQVVANIWKHLFSNESLAEKRTLYQLKIYCSSQRSRGQHEGSRFFV